MLLSSLSLKDKLKIQKLLLQLGFHCFQQHPKNVLHLLKSNQISVLFCCLLVFPTKSETLCECNIRRCEQRACRRGREWV